eukprot:m51a1_g4654 hypothetical protein (733) ;mRNA; f:25352-28921
MAASEVLRAWDAWPVKAVAGHIVRLLTQPDGKPDEAALVALRQRLAVAKLAESLSDAAMEFRGSAAPPSALWNVLELLRLLLHRRLGRALDPVAAKDDWCAVLELVDCAGAVDVLRAVALDGALADGLRQKALAVLGAAAYNGVRLPQLLECAGAASTLLGGAGGPVSFGVAAAAAEFLSHITSGMEQQRLDSFECVVDAVSSALGTIAALEGAAPSADALRVASTATNVLVHLSQGMRDAILSSGACESLDAVVHSVDWRPAGVRQLGAALAVAVARLAHSLVPDYLGVRATSLPRKGDVLEADFVDRDGRLSPWHHCFAAALHIGFVLGASASEMKAQLFTPESPVREAMVFIALTIEVELRQAVGEVALLLHVLQGVRCRLWLGGLVPPDASEDQVSFWTELCACGLLPSAAMGLCDNGSDSPQEMASRTLWQRLASFSPAEFSVRHEGVETNEEWDRLWRANLHGACAEASRYLQAPWLARLRRSAAAAIERSDTFFDVSFAAMGIALVPLNDLLVRPEGGSVGDDDGRGSGDDAGDGSGGDRREQVIANIIRLLDEHKKYLFHASIVSDAQELLSDREDAIGARDADLSQQQRPASDFAPTNGSVFYLCDDIETAYDHAVNQARQGGETQLCIIAFELDSDELLQYSARPSLTTRWDVPAEMADRSLVAWRPNLCDWDELHDDGCQFGGPASEAHDDVDDPRVAHDDVDEPRRSSSASLQGAATTGV